MNVPEQHGSVRSGKTPGQYLALGLVRLYQLTLSAFIGRQCRYLPTCSDYAAQGIERFGVWPGFWMGLARIGRCHPYGGDGFDPIPEQLPESASWYMPWRYGRWRPSGARSGGKNGP